MCQTLPASVDGIFVLLNRIRIEGSISSHYNLADPGSWQIAAPVAGDFANIFLYARAKIANAIGKPWILEETGMEVRGVI